MSKGRPPIVTPGQVVPYTGNLFVPPQPPPPFNFSTSYVINLGGLYGTAAIDYGKPQPRLPLPVAKREMPVVGYRAWTFSSKFRIGRGRDVALKSTGVNFHWRPGDNRATCSVASHHRAPDENCHCGFYVLGNLYEVESHRALTDGVVVGAVMGWGKVVQHSSEGWRAEYAKIIALLDCKYSKGQLRNTQQAAAAYGVEVKSRDGLEAILGEFGDPFTS